MKLTSSLALAVALSAGAALAAPPTPSPVLDVPAEEAAKQAAITGVNDPQPQVAGDDIASAVNIPFLPYSDSGNTCPFLNDYDEACPYVGSASPDVVYRYAPLWDTVIGIDLCSSLYDTKVYVYQNSPGTVIACNDDANCGYSGWQSRLECLSLSAGNEYYIVVDGYGGDCGVYDINVVEGYCGGCVSCASADVLEGETDCFPDYEDHYDGGCDSAPNVFLPVPCSPAGETVELCGTYGGFQFGGWSYRDTDWYVVDGTTNTSGFTWWLMGEYATIMGYIRVQPCEEVSGFEEFLALGECQSGSLEVPPGDFWLWVGTDGFGSEVGCGHEYTWTVTGYDCGSVSVEPVSWGDIKTRYR